MGLFEKRPAYRHHKVRIRPDTDAMFDEFLGRFHKEDTKRKSFRAPTKDEMIYMALNFYVHGDIHGKG